ncbi:MAG: homoserine O-acetyltransferase [Sulfobacillus thermotolerans]|uniref:Homoserine O-acetyltransferase n=1 Tax=Sulfobacillus thermotolerans TaxID=338644 RepID=A0ABN5H3M2_9FIRM|nr:homoserine O-acetyltransferase [Sulfobacillus thermotolerans]MCY0907717.1 homoserine O-acetyltransferase [Sulfobacillus thermotolerans]
MGRYPYPIWPWQVSQGFPWPRLQFYRAKGPFVLDSGESLPELLLAYEEWGKIGSGIPVVIFHALTGDSHVTRHTYQDAAGWWDAMVGFGKAIDLHQYHVISVNVLGGAMGTTGPHSPGPDGHPYGSRFPRITLYDMARASRILLEEAVQLADRPILIGGSMGGMVAYAYGALYAKDIRGILAIGSPIRHSPWAIAFHTVGRMAITSDPAFNNGDYYLSGSYPTHGLALARMADMISYQSPVSMDKKFGRHYQTAEREEFQISSYLRYQGLKLVRRFDANTYLKITEAMDRFDLVEDEAVDAMRSVPVWMVGITSDQLYLYDEIRQHAEILREAGVRTRFETLNSPWGHDSFLVDAVAMAKIVRRFLQAMSRVLVSSE